MLDLELIIFDVPICPTAVAQHVCETLQRNRRLLGRTVITAFQDIGFGCDEQSIVYQRAIKEIGVFDRCFVRNIGSDLT